MTGVDLATPADDPALLDLFRAVYPGAAVDERVLAWRYREVPGGPAPILVGRDAGGRPHAMLVLLPRDLTVDGVRHPGWLIVDVMTHPSARGRGVLRALSRACLEKSRAEGRVTCGYPNLKSARGFLSTGWTPIGPIPEWRLSVAPGEATEPARWRPAQPPFPAWVDGLWPLGDRVGVHRDRAYWTWRLARPDATYEPYLSDREDGLVVLKRYGADVLNVVALLAADPARADEALALAEATARRLGRRALTIWVAPGHPYQALVEARGYRRQPTERVAFTDAPTAPRAHEAEAWHVAQLDSDVF